MRLRQQRCAVAGRHETAWHSAAAQLAADGDASCPRRMADPKAVKPDDWDEDAPMEVEDEEAEKPEGWLDDEPDEIDDPGARPVPLVSARRPSSLLRIDTKPTCAGSTQMSAASHSEPLPFP